MSTAAGNNLNYVNGTISLSVWFIQMKVIQHLIKRVKSKVALRMSLAV